MKEDKDEEEKEQRGRRGEIVWGAVSSEDGAVQRTWWVPGEPETVGVRVQMWPK